MDEPERLELTSNDLLSSASASNSSSSDLTYIHVSSSSPPSTSTPSLLNHNFVIDTNPDSKREESLEITSLKTQPYPTLLPHPQNLKAYQLPHVCYEVDYRPIANIFFGPTGSQHILEFYTNIRVLTFFFLLWFSIFVLHWFTLFKLINSNWSYLVMCIWIIQTSPSFLLLNINMLVLLIQTFDYWYFALQLTAMCIELGILFRDGRLGISITYWVGVMWICHMDAMPQRIRRFASLLTFLASLDFILGLIFVHYELYPDLVDFKFYAGGVEWTCKQLFSSSCFIVALYFVRYTVLQWLQPEHMVMIKPSLLPKIKTQKE